MSCFDMQAFKSLKFISVISDTTILYLNPQNSKKYVVKTVDGSLGCEYEKIAKIDSPYLSKILFIAKEGEKISIVREYIEGDTIAELLESSCFSEADTYNIVLQIAKGLYALHEKQLVHRDINPNNIIIDKNKNVKIIDYGIVRGIKNNKSKDTTILGTVGYAAPEQFGFRQSDYRTDIYALGVLANVMLTKKLPNEQITSTSFKGFVKKCTEIDPQKRYKTTKEIVQYLKHQKRNWFLKIIKSIPGYRGKNPFVPIVATIWYFICIFVTVFDMIRRATFFGCVLSVLYWSFLWVIPTLFVANFLNIYDKFILTKKLPRLLQRLIFLGFSIISVFISFLLIAFAETVLK